MTAGATAVSTAGVSMVGSEVTDSHPTLSAGRVDELAAAPASAGPSVTPTTAVVVTTTTTTVARRPPTTTTSPAAHPVVPPTTAKPPPQPQSATYASRGGVVTVTCRGPEITLDSARPNDGYQLFVRDDGPERVVVEFAGEGTQEVVGAGCRDGHPVVFDGRKRREPPPPGGGYDDPRP